MRLKLGSNKVMLSVALEYAKCIARTNAQVEPKHDAVIQHCQVAHVIDQALCLSLVAWRRGSLSDDRWLRLWAPAASLIMNVDMANKVYAATGKWSSVADDVTKLVATTHLGSALFAWALPSCVASRLRDHAEKLLGALAKEKTITTALIDGWWKQVRDEASTLKAEDVLSHRRLSTFEYRKSEVSIEVPTWEDELSLLLACWIKSRFCPSVIPELAFEKGLVKQEVDNPGKIDEQLVQVYVQGREYVSDLISRYPQQGTVLVTCFGVRSR